MNIVALHHVQLAMPPGQEELAREFYQNLLGIPEVPKPEPMASRGGAWFERGTLRVHLGIEADFRPAKKAHPALVVEDYEACLARVQQAGLDFRSAENLGKSRRGFLDDPFGNRVELVEAVDCDAPKAVQAQAEFAVIYRWRLDPARVSEFQEAWAAMTRLIRSERGGLGSRLHRSADGCYLAYAQWPSREAWMRSRELGSPDANLSQRMQDAVIGTFDDIELSACADLLIPAEMVESGS